MIEPKNEKRANLVPSYLVPLLPSPRGYISIHYTYSYSHKTPPHWRLGDKIGEFLGLTVGTPLQKKLAQLFLWLFGFAVICAIIVLGANKFESRKDVVIYAVTVAVGTIPVSLLLVLTVTMAAGTKKMLERNVMVRNLSSLEALGGVTSESLRSPLAVLALTWNKTYVRTRQGQSHKAEW